MGACALLLIQYLLGMVVNVYVVLPSRHPGAGAGDYLSGAAAGLAWVVADGPAWAAAHAAFVNYGHAFSSMIMAGLWALALACYLAGAILAYRPQSIAPAKPQLALFSLIRPSPIARRQVRCRPGWAGSSSPRVSERLHWERGWAAASPWPVPRHRTLRRRHQRRRGRVRLVPAMSRRRPPRRRPRTQPTTARI